MYFQPYHYFTLTYPIPQLPVWEITSLLLFQLNFQPCTTGMTTGLGAAPVVLCNEDLATSWRLGSFNYNWESSLYLHEWANITKFDTWYHKKELAYSIELIISHIAHRKKLWTLRCHYVCSWQLSGGKKTQYQRKCPDWKTKNSKKTGCKCKITIKQYPDTLIILRWYEEEHDHKVSLANVTYMWISSASQEQIKNMLERKIDPREIMCGSTILTLAVDLTHL